MVSPISLPMALLLADLQLLLPLAALLVLYGSQTAWTVLIVPGWPELHMGQRCPSWPAAAPGQGGLLLLLSLLVVLVLPACLVIRDPVSWTRVNATICQTLCV